MKLHLLGKLSFTKECNHNADRSFRKQRATSYGVFSRFASRLMEPPAVAVTVLWQVLKPDFSRTTMWSPGDNWIVEGVVPINLPSIVISAPSGADLIATADRLGVTPSDFEAVDSETTAVDCLNLAPSSGVSPAMYAVISVPFGIVMSLPCMNRKNGAAGKKRILVATIAPVIAPV